MICGNDGKTNVKIIDFGIARLVENSDLGGHTLTRTNSVFGSPAYMSPEQCRGAKVDHLSDIYSCACIMFEALNGVPPLVGATSIETMYKHMSEVPPSMRLQATDERGNKLGQLIDSCLEKEPSARPQSAAEVLACLDELFSERLDTGSLFSSEMKRQSSKPQYGIFMLLAILVVVGIGIWSLQINRAKNSVVLEQISSANKSEKIHRMEELERDLQRSEKYYQRAQNSAEKLVFAERIFEQSRELAMAQRGCSEFGTAEANLSQALALAKVSGGARTHHCSDLYNALIDCLIQDNKIQRAEELLAEFKKLEGLTGEARARQVLLRMKIECKTHNLEPMFEQFSSMVEFCGDRISANQHFSSFTKTHIDPLSVRMADELWRMIAKEHFESPGEILLAAKMGIAVAKLEVEKQCPIAASRSLHGAASFLKQLNKSLKGYAEAAQQLNKLAEQSGIEL
jgi:pentatricopeptide repeat protein